MGLTAEKSRQGSAGRNEEIRGGFRCLSRAPQSQGGEEREAASLARQCQEAGDKIILPDFGKWTVIDMSNNPGAVSDWHARITRKHGPVSANHHCARVIRATYRRAPRRDRTLPVQLPTSDVTMKRPRNPRCLSRPSRSGSKRGARSEARVAQPTNARDC